MKDCSRQLIAYGLHLVGLTLGYFPSGKLIMVLSPFTHDFQTRYQRF
jgi:hypothetical protein